MKKIFAVCLVVASVGLLGVQPARAGLGVAGSIGIGVVRFNGEWNRTAFNIEVTPNYKIGPIFADLGLLFGLEKGNDVVIRPGVRLDLRFLYLRAAIPLLVNNGQDYGFLLGVGKFFSIGTAGVFVEVDVPMSKNLGFADAFPIEFRGGVQMNF